MTSHRELPATLTSTINKNLKEGLAEAEKQMLETSNSIMRSMELRLFADLYALAVPSAKRRESAKAVRELRDEEWKAALTEANGNEDKACDIIFLRS